MPGKSPESVLEKVAARYERRLETVRRIQELVQDDPALAAEIATAFNGRATKRGATEGTGATHFERVKKFFDDRDNAWTSAPEIARALDMKRGILGQMLYKGYVDRFEKRAKRGDKKLKLWRLKGGG
jgi:hypothetical protein